MKLEGWRSVGRGIGGMAFCGLASALAWSCDGGGSGGSGGTGGASTSASTSTTTSATTSTSAGTGGTGGATTGTGGGGGAHLAEWARGFLGSPQIASSVGVDATGNIYVAGTFGNGMVDFGDAQRDCPMLPQTDNFCGFLLKLDATGKTIWSRVFVSDHTVSIDVPALAVVSDGVVIAAAWHRFQGIHAPLDVGAGPLDPAGDYPMVLAKFDPAGTALWSAAYGDDGGFVNPASLAVVGPTSFVVGGGFSTATLDLGGGAMTYTGDHTLFVARFDDKKLAWQKSFGGTSQELGGLAHGPGGEILLGGHFEGSLDFGGPMLTNAASWSLFRAKLDASGAFMANETFDADGPTPSVTGVAADGAGSTFVTGAFDGPLSLGATPLMVQGDINGYLAKLDAQGNVVFTQVTTEPMMTSYSFFSVSTDASNNALWGAAQLFSDPSGDTFQSRITKLDTTGKTLWTLSAANFGPYASAFAADGSVVVVGEFSNKLDISKGAPITGTMASNAFIAKFAP